MSLPTFITTDQLAAESSLSLGEDAAHHMRVLRLEPGARVRLADGQGSRGMGTVIRIAKRNALVQVDSCEFTEPLPPVHLIVPIADRERMLWLGEKCTELGATSWRPVLYRRSKSVSPRGEGPTFQQRLRARMASALEQSGGAWLPVPFPDATVETCIAAAPEGVRLVLAQGGAPIVSLIQSAPQVPVTVVLGPEGGLEESELEVFAAAGFAPASLGTSVLRFETAGVAALAVARALRG
ncbi:MAG: RsmE family RNA methyltransferase [Gemmatimonadetes bacterium]|nr:RsmE family RNA methyltransferase [Gemmatimonadota bacterium]